MLDIPKIYGDPILYDRRRGTPISPYKNKKETVFIETNYAILAEVPNKYDKVRVTGLGIDWYEIDDEEFLEENFYWVDYTHGIVYFHGSHQSKTVNVEYTGEGVRMFPDSRVYHTSDPTFPTIKDKFIDVDRAIKVQKSRVDEQIRSVPQPSEVVDLRVDYNGKIFKVAKDRIDAEQKKIEEAYFDAKGKKFDSLKLRIDSLQLATEKSFDDQKEINIDLRTSIDLIPGKIALETERLEERINGEVGLLQSQIDLVPEKINLSVRELRESVEGQLSHQESYINLLSDRMELKVDVDGVTSAINLSKEGVRIDGKKIWITGETRIDNAAIKSAHIESLDASKIVAGSIDTEKIRIHGGTSTNYTTIDGATFESRGRHIRQWRGETTEHDIRIRIHEGRIRARNDNLDRSLYYSDNGISTFADGSGQYIYDVEKTSGTLEFFSYEYGTPRGVTLYSVGTFGVKTRNMVVETARDIEFKADGMLNFMNTNVRATAIGVREPNTNFYIGVSGERNGELRVTNKGFYNNGNPTYHDVRARNFKGRRFIDTGGSSYIYMGSNLGVRITSLGTNNNQSITYRPIQASAFQVRSSKKSKENIKQTSQKGLETIRQLNVVDFNYKGSKEINTGFVAEESSPISSEDNEFVDLNKAIALLTLAVQELDKKQQLTMEEIKKMISEE